MNPPTIRPAKTTDLPQILKIYNHYIQTSPHLWHHNKLTLTQKQNWFHNLQKNNHPLLIAQTNNQTIGFAWYETFRKNEGYTHTAEHSIYITPTHQKKGIAKTLLKKLIQHAKTTKIHTLIAAIDNTNHPSKHLHKKLGFQQCGTLQQVGKKFNQWRDLTLYQLILTQTKTKT